MYNQVESTDINMNAAAMVRCFSSGLYPHIIGRSKSCTLKAGEYSGQVEFYRHKGFEAEEKTGVVSFRPDVKM